MMLGSHGLSPSLFPFLSVGLSSQKAPYLTTPYFKFVVFIKSGVRIKISVKYKAFSLMKVHIQVDKKSKMLTDLFIQLPTLTLNERNERLLFTR